MHTCCVHFMDISEVKVYMCVIKCFTTVCGAYSACWVHTATMHIFVSDSVVDGW